MTSCIGGINVAKTQNKHLELKPLDVDGFIKVNDVKEITDPVFFSSKNMPAPGGLLSNEIFGITKDDRTSIFGYIHLAGETFMHPLGYKIWCRLDKNVKLCAYEMYNFKVNKETGKLEQDPNGETGIKYLRKIIKDLKIPKTDSDKRNVKVTFLEKYREKLFIDNFLVIPAGYRDVTTDKPGKVTVGEINEMYNAIIRDCNALKESDDYGLSLSGSLRGRIQDSIVAVYDFLAFGRDRYGVESPATGLSRKLGLIRRSGMKKSFDWGARLVICTQNLRKESLSDIDVDLDSVGLPIAALCANFYPYMLYHIRKWFENNMTDTDDVLAVDPKNKKTHTVHIKDWREVYSDDRIKKELDRFMHGMSNRFVAIEAPIEENIRMPKGAKPYLIFKGYNVEDEAIIEKTKTGSSMTTDGLNFSIKERPLTWCDLIYMAAIEITKDKAVLITRFPVDTYWNQFPAKIKVVSTIDTEPMIVNNTFYREYPKIRIQDINKNTTNKFVDVALPNNVRLDSIGGDFDGDTVSSKGIFSIEANDEMLKEINSKKHYISLGGENSMNASKEAIQSLYNLTLVLPDDKNKLKDPVF